MNTFCISKATSLALNNHILRASCHMSFLLCFHPFRNPGQAKHINLSKVIKCLRCMTPQRLQIHVASSCHLRKASQSMKTAFYFNIQRRAKLVCFNISPFFNPSSSHEQPSPSLSFVARCECTSHLPSRSIHKLALILHRLIILQRQSQPRSLFCASVILRHSCSCCC